MPESKKICVFCSSSNATDTIYKKQTIKLGEHIALNGHVLLYGGADAGLMRILLQSVKKEKGKSIGVIPKKIADLGLADHDVDELIITPDMHGRKAKLESMADAFIILPGGFGTLEELSEVLTLKQLGYFNKPIVLLNINKFYDPLIAFYEHLYESKFAKEAYRKLYYVTENVSDALKHTENYNEEIMINKWFQ